MGIDNGGGQQGSCRELKKLNHSEWKDIQLLGLFGRKKAIGCDGEGDEDSDMATFWEEAKLFYT